MSGTGQARRAHRRRGGVRQGPSHRGDAGARARRRGGAVSVAARWHGGRGGSASDCGDECMGNRERRMEEKGRSQRYKRVIFRRLGLGPPKITSIFDGQSTSAEIIKAIENSLIFSAPVLSPSKIAVVTKNDCSSCCVPSSSRIFNFLLQSSRRRKRVPGSQPSLFLWFEK